MENEKHLLYRGIEGIEGTEPLTTEHQREKTSPSLLYSRAVSTYQQALAAMQAVSDPLLQADILSQMGGAYSKLGKHSDSLEAIKQSLALYKQVSVVPLCKGWRKRSPLVSLQFLSKLLIVVMNKVPNRSNVIL